jgi:hypothetical protein
MTASTFHIRLCSSSLDPLPCHLSPVQSGERWHYAVFIFAPLHLSVGCRENDFYVAWVTLVRVDTTVGTICTTAGFLWYENKYGNMSERKATYRSLLDDDVFDDEVIESMALRFSI